SDSIDALGSHKKAKPRGKLYEVFSVPDSPYSSHHLRSNSSAKRYQWLGVVLNCWVPACRGRYSKGSVI
ncbi:hypothetical protein, partial [Escherichia coli]